MVPGGGSAMTKLNLEKLAAERRMKKRGTERVSGSGFTVELAQRANAGVRSAERFIEAAKSYRPIEEAVETARHAPDAKLDGQDAGRARRMDARHPQCVGGLTQLLRRRGDNLYMATNFEPTEDELKAFMRSARGTIRRRIDPQPWPDGDRMWMWKRPDSPREFDVAWVERFADDFMDDACPLAKRGRVFWKNERGLKIKAESVRAENMADGWQWVIMWRVA
jgi:hypothetical protein